MLQDLLNFRRAVRHYDPAKAIDSAVVRHCLELAQLAPSSSNLQLYEFYHITGDGVAVALTGLLGAANPAYRDALGTIGVAIRNLGNFPDGVAFAILIANGLVPLIDSLTQPRYR